jgi:hypothetical protein
MLRPPVLVAALSVLGSAFVSLAQTPIFTPFPAKENVQTVLWHQIAGCTCGINPNQTAFPFLQKVEVSPKQVNDKVGHDIKIRYDASAICNGQTIRDPSGKIYGQGNGPLGTATWQAGTVQDLPDVFGDLSLRGGYAQAGKYTITINMNLQCYDTGAKCTAPNHYNVCNRSVTIPVNITN